MEVQAPTEQNLLGSDWPTEHDDTTHMKCGYYRKDNGLLGRVVNGVKLTESEDDYSSSQSAKRAKRDFCASDSEPSDVGGPKVGASKSDKDRENSGAKKDDDEEKTDDDTNNKDTDEEESESFIVKDVCRQIIDIDDDGNEEECGGETDGFSQMCHSCKHAMKRGWFVCGLMH
jgi:hypothetical protein